MRDALETLSGSELLRLLKRREVSNQEVVSCVLTRIAEDEPLIHAFITLRDKAEILRDAEGLDRRRRRGQELGALGGLPVAVKDNICTAGLRTTAGSRMLRTYVPPFDATVVRRIKEADGIVLGKTNLDEFSMGSSTETSAFGPTRNPRNHDYVPGGTSGGSAAAVAAGETVMALGSDTGGSIRQPASFCGVVGLKPTYGRVSRHGLIAHVSSFDQIGPLARTVEDAELLFRVIEGADAYDSTCQGGVSLESDSGDRAPIIVGIPREYFVDGLHNSVRTATERAQEVLGAAGCQIEAASLPSTARSVAAYYIIACAEASSNLARYTGVHFGYRAGDWSNLQEMVERTRSEGFGTEVKRRLLLGSYVLSAGHRDSFYGKARAVQAIVRREFQDAFRSCDVLLTPVSPVPPFRLGDRMSDPLAMYLVDVLTVGASLAGVPAISVPFGQTTEGLPLSVQLIGRPHGEKLLFRMARVIEAATRQG